jgi:hypothetical protein
VLDAALEEELEGELDAAWGAAAPQALRRQVATIPTMLNTRPNRRDPPRAPIVTLLTRLFAVRTGGWWAVFAGPSPIPGRTGRRPEARR